MLYKEIEEYIGKNVIVTDTRDKKFRGTITNTESEFDTESGKEEIELYTGKVYYGIPLDEIKNIIKIERGYPIEKEEYYYEDNKRENNNN